jgi:parallel beta-helix repeat protein
VVLLGFSVFGPTALARDAVQSNPVSSAVADRPVGSLQALIDAAPPDAVVVVPPGLYRETISIHRPITLDGGAAEIRGSDVWTDWTSQDGRWISADTVPQFDTGWPCVEERCDWPEQVFVDGMPLVQVGDRPNANQFTVDARRHVILDDDPAGHLVEVTVRRYWMVVDGPDVTIDGFTMRDAATPAQFGALQAKRGADRLIVRNVTLSDAHAALVSFQDVADAGIYDSDLSRGGELGIQSGGTGTTNLTISGNHVYDNNTEGFDAGWEAGGMKVTQAKGLRIVDNDVTGNQGPGVWCDIDCVGPVIEGNRISSNANAGILFEISTGATIEGNMISENGWGYPTWGWGGGIVLSSSSESTVRNNVLAWNADGISVISQDRGSSDADGVHDTMVVDNTILADPAGGYMLAWLQDWNGAMYDEKSNNAGRDNRFWPPATSPCRFDWNGCLDDIDSFATTAGGAGSVYITNSARDQVLTTDRLPAIAQTHPVGETPRRRDVIMSVLGLGGVLGLSLAGVVLVLARRRRARQTT